jgi:hypothetical protein
MRRLSTLSVLLLLLTLAGGVSAQRRALPTIVRVLQPGGGVAVGAEVLAVSSPEPEAAARRPFVIQRAKTDARGAVRIELEDGQHWAVWAVLDKERERYATPIDETVTPGRGTLLRLEPFAVPFVRLVGVDAWRDVVEGELGLRFTVQGRFGVHLPAKLPEGNDPVVRVPALPLGNYFPTLIDSRGRALDFTYFSPAFHEGDAGVEPLYEREYPLKRAVLGKPVLHEYVVRGRNPDDDSGAELPVPGALVRVEFSLPVGVWSDYQADAQGRVRIPLAFRAEAARARYTVEAQVLAQGRWPRSQSLEVRPEPAQRAEVLISPWHGTPFELPLEPLRERYGADARFYVASHWRHGRSNFGPTGRLELPLRGDDKLLLPSLPDDSAHFDLYVATRSRLEPLFIGRPSGFIQAEGKLPWGLTALDVQVRREGGGRALATQLHAIAEANVGGLQASREIPVSCDRRGHARLQLPAGKWLIYARSRRDGDGLARIEIGAKEGERGGQAEPLKLELQSFRNIQGVVVDADDKPVAGAEVSAQVQTLREEDPRLRRLLQTISRAVQTDEAGAFTLRFSSQVTRLSVWCSFQKDGQWSSASQSVPGDHEEKIRLQLGQ